MGQPSTAAKPQKRDADTKLAQSRLSVLELAKELGNVAEACRQRGVDRTSFYELETPVPDAGLRGSEGPAAHLTRATRRAPRSRWYSASRSWRWRIRPMAAIAMKRCWPGRHPRLGDHHPEDPQRQRAWHATASRRCRPISMPGSSTTTQSDRILVIATWAAAPSKPSCHSSAKKVKRTTSSTKPGQIKPASVELRGSDSKFLAETQPPIAPPTCAATCRRAHL